MGMLGFWEIGTGTRQKDEVRSRCQSQTLEISPGGRVDYLYVCTVREKEKLTEVIATDADCTFRGATGSCESDLMTLSEPPMELR